MPPVPPVIDVRRREPVTQSGRQPISIEGLPLGLDKINPFNISQQGLSNCPLPAIMSAMANACPGRIRNMFQENTSVVKSWFDDEQENARFMTNRIIKIQFRTGSIRVSPVLYFNAFKKPRFARSTDGAGWVSYLEKAYVIFRARHRYENLNMDAGGALPVHQFVMDILGNYDKVELETITVTKNNKQVVTAQGDILRNIDENLETTNFSDDLRGNKLEEALEKMLRKVKKRATIATTPAYGEYHSNFGLVGSHTYAVLSYNDSKNRLTLFDAMNGMPVEIDLDDFKMTFDAVYQATE